MPLFYLKECSSTHDEIEKFLSVDLPGLQAVYTFNQTKGKGQYGNSWESGHDLNIAYSVAVPTELINLQNHLFNFRTAQLVADFLAIMTNCTPEIKWPNDIIINKKKVSGILLEKKMQRMNWSVGSRDWEITSPDRHQEIADEVTNNVYAGDGAPSRS